MLGEIIGKGERKAWGHSGGEGRKAWRQMIPLWKLKAVRNTE